MGGRKRWLVFHLEVFKEIFEGGGDPISDFVLFGETPTIMNPPPNEVIHSWFVQPKKMPWVHRNVGGSSELDCL